MKKVLNVFFVTLGVIFFILILMGLYFYITDPLNLKPLLFGGSEYSVEVDSSTTIQDKHPVLNESQERVAETLGIDPATLPTELTAEQRACFAETLGEARVAEIVGGDSPNATD